MEGALMSRIAVVVGSTRQGRFADKPAQWVAGHLAKIDGIEVDVIDLRDHPLPPFDVPPPARTQRDYPTPETARLGERVDRADGFIILTAEYNHGYPAVLKNAMDHTFVEWQRKPVAFVGWGNVGGARAIEQLRSVAIEFEMAPLRHAVHILPDLLMSAKQAPEPFDPALFAPLDDRLYRLVTELLWWTRALAGARAADAS
jgi:NAD(P)H-dependent FMN reductase